MRRKAKCDVVLVLNSCLYVGIYKIIMLLVLFVLCTDATMDYIWNTCVLRAFN